MFSQLLPSICLVLVACVCQSTSDYPYHKGRSWGYKTEIYHPPPKYHRKYHGGDGYYHKQYHHQYPSHYHSKYDDHDHYDAPYKPHYHITTYEMKYPKKPAPSTPAPSAKKEDDDSFKININLGLKKMFSKHFGKEEESSSKKEEGSGESEEMGSYGGMGYGKKEAPSPPAEPEDDKKEFEVKIPKIDIDGMIDKLSKEQKK